MNYLSIAVVLLPCVLCQGGGMAELKSITGDAPYMGVGNAPAPIPQPMGFWGRPRYSPVGYSSGFYGDPWNGGYNRFTSIGRSPYEEAGPLPFDGPGSFSGGAFLPGHSPVTGVLGAITTLLDFDDSSSRTLGTRSLSPSRNSFKSSGSHLHSPSEHYSPPSSIHTRGLGVYKEYENTPSDSASSPFLSSPSNSFSLSSATGGFYKGKGNDMIRQ
uniref:Secreted protein n=1 Tax=Heterorhabditis bacteriophora TaxID=37862 RepID=A0A1I7WN26_HETBA